MLVFPFLPLNKPWDCPMPIAIVSVSIKGVSMDFYNGGGGGTVDATKHDVATTLGRGERMTMRL